MPMASLLGMYRKMHIPDDPLYFEKYYFTPGDLGFRCFDTRYARIAPLVCWDQWYPEAARLAALGGAQVLFYPTAIGWHPAEKAGIRRGAARRLAHHPARARHRQRALRGGGEPRGLRRAAGARAWSSGAARSWPIRSARCWPRPSHDQEETLIVECDPRRIEEVRRNWPFLRDRRIDAYEPILNRVID